MICAWNELLQILPSWVRDEVDRLGRERLTELRLRRDAPPELILGQEVLWLSQKIRKEDITYCINVASKYSPWSTKTDSFGYISVPGGHRIGLCGNAVMKGNSMSGFREISSLCIRVARDISRICSVPEDLDSFLIIGAPGWGKTTLLRDCVRRISQSQTVVVIDEREELFPQGFQIGKRMDVLSGCPKSLGIEMALRTMHPDYIAVDEITAAEDSRSLLQIIGCGVRVVATAHATSLEDLRSRPIYQPLIAHNLFQTVLLLQKDWSFTVERICE